MKSVSRSVLPAVLLMAVAGIVAAQETVQIEGLEPIRCTPGDHGGRG